jgi:AcrR family transcriptional regulator
MRGNLPRMAPERRTRLAPDERYAQLVALGVGFLVERPLHDLTVEWLSRALLFHYFGSKQGLHREVVRVARDSLMHATEPMPGLDPLDRLHDTLDRIVRFVRDHRGTFYSLVRGVASGDSEVREVVEQARVEQAERAISVVLELGMADTPQLRMALRSWVALAEESLVSSELPPDELVAFLERTAVAVAGTVDTAVGRAR